MACSLYSVQSHSNLVNRGPVEVSSLEVFAGYGKYLFGSLEILLKDEGE
jgi:hypothetical protein